MKANSSVDLLKILWANKALFLDAQLSIQATSGNSFSGYLVDASFENGIGAILLRSSRGDDFHWLALTGVEALSIHAPTSHQMAVLSGKEFDPLTSQQDPGRLFVAREVQETQEKLAEILMNTGRLVLEMESFDAESVDRAMKVASLRSVLAMLPGIFKELFRDDFARTEFQRTVGRVVLLSAKDQRVTISGHAMQILCPWQSPAERWVESDLKKAINAAF
jgi:hypothetical protein